MVQSLSLPSGRTRSRVGMRAGSWLPEASAVLGTCTCPTFKVLHHPLDDGAIRCPVGQSPSGLDTGSVSNLVMGRLIPDTSKYPLRSPGPDLDPVGSLPAALAPKLELCCLLGGRRGC